MLDDQLADGGCDRGYRMTSCLWGRDPEPLVLELAEHLPAGATVVDAGCGEGRNAVYLASRGHGVRAFDVSPLALANARASWPSDVGVEWELGDAASIALAPGSADAVIIDSVFHWLADADAVAKVSARLQRATRPGGRHLVAAFNDRHQDLAGHVSPPRCILSHERYLDMYRDWYIESCEDIDIASSHADVPAVHAHSITKFIAVRS